MAKILIATMPFISHITPSLAIARELVGRGHEVRWYTGRKFQAKVEATGATFLPLQAAPDFDEDRIDEVYPERAKLAPVAQFKWSIKHVFVDPAPAQIADLRAILADFPADVLLSESTLIGAELLHELGGPPWAAFNILPLTIASRDTAPFGLGLSPRTDALGRLRNQLLNRLFATLLFRDVAQHYNRLRATLGLRPTATMGVSPLLVLQGTTPAFEYPRSDLPPQVHFIGPFLPEPPAAFAPPAWWPELHAGRKVVLVTQGTVATDAADLVAPALRGLAGEDLLVAATTGGRAAELAKLAPIPANARVEPFVPFTMLMPHVAAIVTNGGYGGVQLALAHGVPLVVAGTTQEKPEVAARVAWSGAGINLKTQRPTPEQVRDAVRRVLREPQFRAAAGRIAAEFALHAAPREAADLLEQLAATGQPVLRGAVERAAVPS